MTKQEVMTAALQLEPADRVDLAEQLLGSISSAEQERVDAAWLAEIERRDAAYRRGEMTARPVEEFLAELKARAR